MRRGRPTQALTPVRPSLEKEIVMGPKTTSTDSHGIKRDENGHSQADREMIAEYQSVERGCKQERERKAIEQSERDRQATLDDNK